MRVPKYCRTGDTTARGPRASAAPCTCETPLRFCPAPPAESQGAAQLAKEKLGERDFSVIRPRICYTLLCVRLLLPAWEAGAEHTLVETCTAWPGGCSRGRRRDREASHEAT